MVLTHILLKISLRGQQCLVCLNPWLLLARLCKTVQFTVSCRAHIGNYTYEHGNLYLHESLHTGP